MLSEERIYHFKADILLQQSKISQRFNYPQEDPVNWLFLKDDDHLYSFVYKIERSEGAIYDKPFSAFVSFTMEHIIDIVKTQTTYPVYRGQVEVGNVVLLEMI